MKSWPLSDILLILLNTIADANESNKVETRKKLWLFGSSQK